MNEHNINVKLYIYNCWKRCVAIPGRGGGGGVEGAKPRNSMIVFQVLV